MADSAALALVVGDWVEVPAATQFTIQNTSSLALPVKVAAVKPTTFEGCMYLQGWNSMSKLEDEKHWIYADFAGSSATFTPNNLV